MKTCYDCKKTLNIEMFGRDKRSKDGHKGQCKACKRVESAAWRAQNKDYAQKYRAENKDKSLEYSRKYYHDNKKELNKRRAEYSQKHKDKEAARKKEWYEANKERVLKKKKDRYEANKEEIIRRETDRCRNNIQEVIKKSLRARLRQSLKRNTKVGSAVRDLGCSIAELKLHLEKQFADGMTWENYGKWHIDHIIPLASFDLTDREQLLQACHYTNLQPLWAEDNLRKGAKSPEEYLRAKDPNKGDKK